MDEEMGPLTTLEYFIIAGIISVGAYGAYSACNLASKKLNSPAIEQKARPKQPITKRLVENPRFKKFSNENILTMSLGSYMAYNHLNFKDYAARGVEGCFDKDLNIKVPFKAEAVVDWKPYSVDGRKCGSGTALVPMEK